MQTPLTLTEEEQMLIDRYLDFYNELATGKRAPKTEAQKHFVAMCSGRAKAETEHELAFAKYRRIRVRQKELEKQSEVGIPYFEDGYPRADWCKRSDWKKMRSGIYSDLRRRQRGD
jgi:uncharacterized protein YifE (UPF0438 family)